MILKPFTPDRLLHIAIDKIEAAKGMSPSESYPLRREADQALLAACWMEREGWTTLPSIGPFHNWMPKAGDYVRIGVGAEIKSFNKSLQRTLKRAYTVRVHRVNSGAIYRDHRDNHLVVRNAEIVWPGSGGYWCWTSIHNISPVEDKNIG